MNNKPHGGMTMDHISVGAQSPTGPNEKERYFFKVYLTTYFFDEITKIERASRGCYLYFFEGPKLYLTNLESVYLAARIGELTETIPWQ